MDQIQTLVMEGEGLVERYLERAATAMRKRKKDAEAGIEPKKKSEKRYDRTGSPQGQPWTSGFPRGRHVMSVGGGRIEKEGRMPSGRHHVSHHDNLAWQAHDLSNEHRKVANDARRQLRNLKIHPGTPEDKKALIQKKRDELAATQQKHRHGAYRAYKLAVAHSKKAVERFNSLGDSDKAAFGGSISPKKWKKIVKMAKRHPNDPTIRHSIGHPDSSEHPKILRGTGEYASQYKDDEGKPKQNLPVAAIHDPTTIAQHAHAHWHRSAVPGPPGKKKD